MSCSCEKIISVLNYNISKQIKQFMALNQILLKDTQLGCCQSSRMKMSQLLHVVHVTACLVTYITVFAATRTCIL